MDKILDLLCASNYSVWQQRRRSFWVLALLAGALWLWPLYGLDVLILGPLLADTRPWAWIFGPFALGSLAGY